MEQRLPDWTNCFADASDIPATAIAALHALEREFDVRVALLKLKDELPEGPTFQYPLGAIADSGLVAAVELAAEQRVCITEPSKNGCLCAVPLDDGALGVLLPSPHPDQMIARLGLFAKYISARVSELRLASGMAKIDAAINREIALDHYLDALFDRIVDEIGFEFAAVALVNKRRQQIRMTRTRNVAPGWRIGSCYPLNSPDILADIVRTGKTEVIEGFDRRFHLPTYEKYGHAHLVRIWTPIHDAETVIGVLEAGCSARERSRLMTPENTRMIQEFAHGSASEVRRLVAGGFFLDVGVECLRRAHRVGAAAAGIWNSSGLVLDAADGVSDLVLAPCLDACRLELTQAEGELELGREWVQKHTPDAAAKGIAAVRIYPVRGQGEVAGLMAVFLKPGSHQANSLQVRSYVRRIETSVGEQQMRGDLRQSLERAQSLTNLHGLIHSSATTTGNLGASLKVIAQRALFILEADSVCLYEYFGGEHKFGTLRVREGHFDHEGLLGDSYPRALVDRVLAENDHYYAFTARAEPDLCTQSGSIPRFVERERIESCAIVSLHTGNYREPVGVMFLNYRTARSFTASMRKEIEALARSAAFAISSGRFADQNLAALTRRYRDMEALRRLDEGILQRIQDGDMKAIYSLVMNCLMSSLNPAIGCIMRIDDDGDRLWFRAHVGYRHVELLSQDVAEGVIGKALRDKRSILLSDIAEQRTIYKEWVKGMRSELVVPIIDRDRAIGAINLEHQKVGYFSSHDVRFSELLATRLVFALHSADLYRQIARQIQPRQALGIIAIRTQYAKYELDDVLRLLLTGITAREGLGFSRGMLFLIERGAGTLKGRLAVGSVNLTEARKNWSNLDPPAKGDFDQRLRALLDAVDMFSADVRSGVARECPLTQLIQRLEWPLDSVHGAVRRALDSASEATTVEVATDDWFRDRLAESTGVLVEPYSFTVVPLLARGNVLGVIVADNRFIDLKERQVPPSEDLHTLEAFAELAAMNIENAELMSRLQTESHEELTHQIKAPITLARARLSLLEEELSGHPIIGSIKAVGAILEHARRIATSVRLFATLTLGSDVRGNFRAVNCTELEHWIMDVIHDYSVSLRDPADRLRFTSLLTEDDLELQIAADQLLMDQVVFNLLDNALKYSRTETTVSVRWAVSARHFILDITNSCRQVPVDEVRVCRHRGTRGRVARAISTGSGLGLWIADHVVRAHGGQLEIESPGESFHASVRLPLSRILEP